jgi:hypothetical protein
MRLRRAAPLTACALLALSLVSATAAPAGGAERPHRKQQPRVGIAKRVAVQRSAPRRRLPLGNDVISLRAPATPGAGDPTPTAPEPIAPDPPAPTPSPKACTEVVANLTAVQAAIRTAAPGAVVCLTDGSYGPLTLTATKSALVTLQAQHPGGATLDGVDVSGAHLAIERFLIGDEVVVEPGSSAIAIAYNRISGGYFGVDAGPTTTTTIDDTAIVGNQFIGPFGEDAIHLNRYHDSDGDGVGVLVEGNEITGVRENGNHSDCLQTVWVGDHIVFRKNYLHDNRCQGFFVKDQDAGGEGAAAGPVVGIAIEDNLLLRNNAPCAPEASECGEPSYLHLYGPYSELTLRHNTIWGGEPVAAFQEGTGSDTTIDANVAYRFWTSTDLSAVAYADNTRCQRDIGEGGLWPEPVSGENIDCAPAFLDPASDDYRLAGSSRGVTWAPSQLHFGP